MKIGERREARGESERKNLNKKIALWLLATFFKIMSKSSIESLGDGLILAFQIAEHDLRKRSRKWQLGAIETAWHKKLIRIFPSSTSVHW